MFLSTGEAAFVISLVLSAVILAFIAVLVIMLYCKWSARKNRPSGTGSEQCCVESPRISNSCSTETASTANMDGTSSHTDSDRASDVVPNHPTDSPKQVLIVGSQSISTEKHAQLVAAPLMRYKDIKILMHGVDTKLEDQRLPPSTWVQQKMDQAEFVVCICNKEFMDDWCYDGQKMCHEASLVRSVSEHVAGLVNHGQNKQVQEKFIAVVHSEEDKQQYIPASLKNCNLFVLNCDANVERLARFLLGIPTVTLQRRNVDDIGHISSVF